MKNSRCLISSIAVFITFFALEFVIHGLCLSDTYKQFANLWRPEAEMQKMMWLMWLGYLIFSPFFVHIYSKGYEEGKSGLGQGLRYGLAMGIMLSPLMALSWYAILPISKHLAAYWLAAGVVEYTVMGLVVGLIWKKS